MIIKNFRNFCTGLQDIGDNTPSVNITIENNNHSILIMLGVMSTKDYYDLYADNFSRLWNEDSLKELGFTYVTGQLDDGMYFYGFEYTEEES